MSDSTLLSNRALNRVIKLGVYVVSNVTYVHSGYGSSETIACRTAWLQSCSTHRKHHCLSLVVQRERGTVTGHGTHAGLLSSGLPVLMITCRLVPRRRSSAPSCSWVFLVPQGDLRLFTACPGNKDNE